MDGRIFNLLLNSEYSGKFKDSQEPGREVQTTYPMASPKASNGCCMYCNARHMKVTFRSNAR